MPPAKGKPTRPAPERKTGTDPLKSKHRKSLEVMPGPPKDLFASPERQAVLQRAIDVFGNEMKARRWFLKQVPALGHHTPYSFLDKPETRQLIGSPNNTGIRVGR